MNLPRAKTRDAVRAAAEVAAAKVPPVLLQAERLAETVLLGAHGRRRSGIGDTFWQYRNAGPLDDARRIDWRRSARGDQTFVQEREWQVARNVVLWVDQAHSMRFGSAGVEKAERAAVLGLAVAIILLRGGERAGIVGPRNVPPMRGASQIARLTAAILETPECDYGVPPSVAFDSAGVIMISDFLGDIEAIESSVGSLAARGRRGILFQIVDPHEREFPFEGRTIFESMGGTIRHETDRAAGLREGYRERFAQREAALRDLARSRGWIFGQHVTDRAATEGLVWLRNAVEGQA